MTLALLHANAVTTTATTTVTPSIGVATTAGSLLVVRAVSNIPTQLTTTSTGWVKAAGNTNSGAAAIFYKPNCAASEAAPVINGGTATFMVADLLEFSGADPTSPADKTNAPLSVVTVPNSAADAQNDDVAVVVYYITITKTATLTVTETWTPSGGTVIAAQGTGATKQATHFWGSAYLLGGNGGSAVDQDAISLTPSTGSSSVSQAVIASFKAPPPRQITNHPVVVSQAVARASTW